MIKLALKFIPVIVSITPISALALDFLVIRSMDKNEPGYAENGKVVSQYIKDREKLYTDLTVIKISGSSSQTVMYRTPNATGANRIIYVDRGQINSWEFLEYIDGTAYQTDRSQPGRQIQEIMVLGHGSPEGPKSFLKGQGVAVHPYQRDFCTWENLLAGKNKRPEEFFTRSASAVFGTCSIGSARGLFPTYMANIMPDTGRVYASTELVNPGIKSMLGFGHYYRKDLYSEGFKSFQKSTVSNSLLTTHDELLYLQKQLRPLIKDIKAGNDPTAVLERYGKMMEEFETNPIALKVIEDFQQLLVQARRGALSDEQLAGFIKRLIKIRQEIRRKVDDHSNENKNESTTEANSEKELEIITVSAKGDNAISKTILNVGERYKLIVTGTFQYDEGEMGTQADAQHEENDDLQFTVRQFLAINGQLRGAEKSDLDKHTYEYTIIGNGKPLSLHIEDSGYDDNAGSLTAHLYGKWER